MASDGFWDKTQNESLTRWGHSPVLRDSGWRGAGSWRNSAIADCRAPGGWSHCGEQFGTEPTSLALLALHSSSSASTVPGQELEPLLACQRPNGLWPAVGNGTADVSFWASAMAVNTLMILGAAPEMFVGALDRLVYCRPLEASWLVRLKFRLSDRQVRFDPAKYGWAWVPDTVSWVVPTSMALIALERAKRQGLIRGSELQKRLHLGVEMLLDRACPEAGGTRATPWKWGYQVCRTGRTKECSHSAARTTGRWTPFTTKKGTNSCRTRASTPQHFSAV